MIVLGKAPDSRVAREFEGLANLVMSWLLFEFCPFFKTLSAHEILKLFNVSESLCLVKIKNPWYNCTGNTQKLSASDWIFLLFDVRLNIFSSFAVQPGFKHPDPFNVQVTFLQEPKNYIHVLMEEHSSTNFACYYTARNFRTCFMLLLTWYWFLQCMNLVDCLKWLECDMERYVVLLWDCRN